MMMIPGSTWTCERWDYLSSIQPSIEKELSNWMNMDGLKFNKDERITLFFIQATREEN